MTERESWPPFRRSVAELKSLARYVAPEHVNQLGISVGGEGRRLLQAEGSRAGRRLANAETVRRLYDAVVGLACQYASEPVTFDAHVQEIRHPDVIAGGRATCLDLAVLFGSLCLAERVAPLLVYGATGQDGHAWVVLDLERAPDEIGAASADRAGGPSWLAGLAEADGVVAGTAEGVLPALRSARFLAVDITRAAWRDTQAPDGFDDACDQGRARLRGTGSGVWVIDVVEALRVAGPPHARPREAPLGWQLPQTPTFRDLRGRREQFERLCRARGMAVVLGAQGLGKSMLAVHAAAPARGVPAWFLSAGSVTGLKRALGLAEARREGYQDGSTLSELQVEALAARARERFASSRVPWLLVVDNANLDDADEPRREIDGLLRWLPTPKPELRQAIIVTSTNEAWAEVPAIEVIRLEPLDAVLRYPEALLVGGRPLFAEAYERFAALVELSVDELAGHVEDGDGDEAADRFWALVRRLAPGARRTELLALAETAAWAAADALDVATLAAAAEVSIDAFYGAFLESGVVEPGGHGTARMHRLVGAAIRRWQLEADLRGALGRIDAVARRPEMLDVEALRVVLHALPSAVAAPAVTPAELGRVLHRVGTIAEPVLGAGLADQVMQLALGLLPDDDHRRRADCLHSGVRQVFQSKKHVPDLEAALPKIDRALEHRREARVGGADEDAVVLEVEELRSVALWGLVRVELAIQQLKAAQCRPGDEAYESAMRLAEEGNAAIDRSLARREDLLADPFDPDLLRGRFNQGMVASQLAQHATDAVRRAALLDTSFTRYREVAEQREQMRPRPPAPQIASCYAGMALVEYLRAVDPKLTPGDDDRAALLRSADRHLHRALELRESVEPVDGDEVKKTSYLGAKIALARFTGVLRRADPSGGWTDAVTLRDQLVHEMPDLGAAWWPTPDEGDE